MLTPKQEKFVQGIFNGLTQRQAYKQAYDTSRMKDSTVDQRAYELFKTSEIKARYEELLNENKEKALYTLEEAINDLIWIKEQAREDILNPKKGLRQGNGTIFVNSVKELIHLNALEPPKKQEVTIQGEVNNPFENLTTKQLLKLIGEESEK